MFWNEIFNRSSFSLTIFVNYCTKRRLVKWSWRERKATEFLMWVNVSLWKLGHLCSSAHCLSSPSFHAGEWSNHSFEALMHKPAFGYCSTANVKACKNQCFHSTFTFLMLAFSKLNPSWVFGPFPVVPNRTWMESKGGPSAATLKSRLLYAGSFDYSLHLKRIL